MSKKTNFSLNIIKPDYCEKSDYGRNPDAVHKFVLLRIKIIMAETRCKVQAKASTELKMTHTVCCFASWSLISLLSFHLQLNWQNTVGFCRLRYHNATRQSHETKKHVLKSQVDVWSQHQLLIWTVGRLKCICIHMLIETCSWYDTTSLTVLEVCSVWTSVAERQTALNDKNTNSSLTGIMCLKCTN